MSGALNIILGVVRAVAEETDRRRVMRRLAIAARKVIPADRVIVATITGQQFDLVVADPNDGAISGTARLTDFPTGAMAASRKITILERADVESYPIAIELWNRLGLQAGLAVPLLAAGELIGALTFQSKTLGAFDQLDHDVATELAKAVAVVLDSCVARELLELLRDTEQTENDELSVELRIRQSADGLVGDCETFRSVKQLVDMVGPTEATVLLAGETGTGKDVVARAVHEASPRRGRPLVTLNCAALPPNLAESELFGHEVGAFTGASKRREGCFERASGGTLFLDEVGELTLEVQAKLLRAIQERVIERVGGSESIALDVRIVAATNRNLSDMVASRRFREDLYYRLAVFPIELPPLRARRDDIPALVRFFVERASARMRVPVRTIAPAAMDRLVAYDWPGNVRELQNAIERAMIVSTGDHLEIDALVPVPAASRTRLPPARSLLPAGVSPAEAALRDEYANALEAAQWVIEGPTGAAARLGVHPNTLRYRLKRLGLQRPG